MSACANNNNYFWSTSYYLCGKEKIADDEGANHDLFSASKLGRELTKPFEKSCNVEEANNSKVFHKHLKGVEILSS